VHVAFYQGYFAEEVSKGRKRGTPCDAADDGIEGEGFAIHSGESSHDRGDGSHDSDEPREQYCGGPKAIKKVVGFVDVFRADPLGDAGAHNRWADTFADGVADLVTDNGADGNSKHQRP
jgi:hypothetical protein